MISIPYSELSEAFEFGAAGEELSAYLSLDTGKFYFVSDFLEPEEELPSDIEDSDRYLLLPGKRDLDLGVRLALRFTEEAFPALLSEVSEIFRRKGAYARYRDFLESHDAVERWYQFEADATKEALLAWCAENKVQVTDA
ncbi:MAG TPA: UPF0158 family protein [Rhodocyclaceae bacterium]|nr:UPF0158 family protein [Rhodocyclaceae bacterium]